MYPEYMMQDASEIVQYDTAGIPLYIREAKLSSYPDMQALCHWHEDLEFIRIKSGKMNYFINGRKLLLEKDDCLFVNTRQMHYGSSFGRQECEFLCILFHPQLFTGNPLLYETYILPVLENRSLECLSFSGASPEGISVRGFLDQIADLKKTAPYGYELEVAGIMSLLFAALRRQISVRPASLPGPGSLDLEAQKAMVSYVYRHYSEKLTLSDIASAGNVGRNKCCAIFRQYLGQSPIDFLNSCRLEISRGLLERTRKSVTDIALACGFNHPSYFSKLFYRSYGQTPGAYRRGFREIVQ